MRLRVIVLALIATAVAVGLVVPSAGAKPKPVKPGQFVTYTCAAGETGSGTVAWLDKNGQVISVVQATASGATLTAGPAPLRVRYYEFSVICAPPDPTIHLRGSFTFSTDEEPHLIYVVNNSDAEIIQVPSCPESTTTLDFDCKYDRRPRRRSYPQPASGDGGIMVLFPWIDPARGPHRDVRLRLRANVVSV